MSIRLGVNDSTRILIVLMNKIYPIPSQISPISQCMTNRLYHHLSGIILFVQQLQHNFFCFKKLLLTSFCNFLLSKQFKLSTTKFQCFSTFKPAFGAKGKRVFIRNFDQGSDLKISLKSRFYSRKYFLRVS